MINSFQSNKCQGIVPVLLVTKYMRSEVSFSLIPENILLTILKKYINNTIVLTLKVPLRHHVHDQNFINL